MYKDRKVVAIISAAGSGKRMAASVPKQFIIQGGQTILETAVSRFTDCEMVDKIYIVVPCDYMTKCSAMFPGEEIVGGGAERQDSIYNAIMKITDDGFADDAIVLVHDGVRPYVNKETIERVIAKVYKCGAAIAAVPTKDTIRHIDEGTLERRKLYNVQTPQGFSLPIIRDALISAFDDGYCGTDDAGLVERIGYKVEIVEGSDDNIKITTPSDLRKEMRTGTGFDVHQLVEGRKLILGGVEIPYEKGLLGHSDADVLTHALMDAMLGAAALGDIGQHFPDNDPAYEGISSLILLERVTSLLDDAGYALENADITVICQRPKLAAYMDDIRENLANAIDVQIGMINVKATTTEKLGFTGRGEGIAAEAVCLIKEKI